jgi:hypothetical protein
LNRCRLRHCLGRAHPHWHSIKRYGYTRQSCIQPRVRCTRARMNKDEKLCKWISSHLHLILTPPSHCCHSLLICTPPSPVRSSGLGVTTVFARIGGAVSPWLCQLLYARSRSLAVFSCVAASLLAACIAANMPNDTKGRELQVHITVENDALEHAADDDTCAAPLTDESALQPAVSDDEEGGGRASISSSVSSSAEDHLHHHREHDLASAESDYMRASLNLDLLKSDVNPTIEVV